MFEAKVKKYFNKNSFYVKKMYYLQNG